MKTGIIILGIDSEHEGLRPFARRCADSLINRGRKNVFVAYGRGEPFAADVMRRMHDEGTDTFSILPLAISEGKHTVWLLPGSVRLPDNFGSWTMIDGKDVATRFSTALGSDPRIADALVRREGGPHTSEAVVLVNRGSPHSSTERDIGFYTEAFRDAGWRAEHASTVHGNDIAKTAKGLVDEGFSRIRVIPISIRFCGRFSSSVKDALKGIDADISYSEPLTELPEYIDALDSKIPDRWRMSDR